MDVVSEAQPDVADVVRRIWQEVLRLPRAVADDDDFFAIGGHSMLGARLMSRVRKSLGPVVGTKLIFSHPVFAEFVVQVRACLDSGIEPAAPVARGRAVGPVSLQQEELLRVETALGPSPLNNVVVAVSAGDAVRADTLRRALQSVLNRHPGLRLGFGEGNKQVIGPAIALSEVDLEVIDDAPDDAIRSAVRHAHLRAFDLGRGNLLRAQLFRRRAGDLLVLHLHHLSVDGQSQSVLLDDLSVAYDAISAGTAPPGALDGPDYLDYAAWQRTTCDDLIARSAGHWRQVVDDLAYDRAPGSAPRLGRYVRDTAEVLPHEVRALREWARAEGATDFVALCAAVAAGFTRVSGRTRVGAGTLLANRSLADFENTVGPFATSTLLAVDVEAASTPRALIRAVRAQLTEARRWSDVPLALLLDQPCAELGLDPSDLVDVVVTMDDPYQAEDGGTLRLTPLLDHGEPLVNTAVGTQVTVSMFLAGDGALRVGTEVARTGSIASHELAAAVALTLRTFATAPDCAVAP
jgi:Condensation domain/Phosphopantetheine attachment site